MTLKSSIGRRIFFSSFIIIFATIVIFEGVFIAGVKQFYYGGALRILSDKALASASFYNLYLKYEYLEKKADTILENYSEQDEAELQIVDNNGNILASSTRFRHDKKIALDFNKTLKPGEIYSWQGKSNITGEEVLAVSTPLVEGDVVTGYLRLVSSMEGINATVNDLVAKAFIVGGSILVLSLILAVILSRTIVKPIKHLTDVSEKIAGGDFDVVAGKRYNDEIGELADTINFMSEEIKKSNSLKNDFISSISHEIRTPLTSIRGWAETINNNSNDIEETRQGIRIILRESKRLTRLVEELLDFSRFESGRMSMNFEKVDLNLLVKDVLKQYKIKFEDRNVRLINRFDNKITFINGDADRLRQVLINIIDNALKFTNTNGTVTVTTQYTAYGAEVCITDDGIGIPLDELPRITEKFYKGKNKQAGSGLGLSISKEIIRLHKGTINMESSEGKGTKVTIGLVRS